MKKFKEKCRKNSSSWILITFLTFSLFMLFFQAVSNAKAESELRVGWLASEMLSTPQCNDAWQYESMGCMFWQLIYDQPWHYGPPPEYAYNLRAITGYETIDNKKFRFFIREGMTFHNNKPVTAKDFAFTYEYLPVSNPIWAYNSSTIVPGSAVVIDEHTVDFELKVVLSPKYPPFDWLPILPQHLWKRYKYDMEKYENSKAIGSGPYMLDSFKAGEYVSFKNFEKYWEKKPRVDKTVFKTYGTTDALGMALKRGEIDMVGYGGVGPMSAKLLEKADNVKLIYSPGISLQWLSFNMFPEGSLKDLNVRKAIVHAIDKERIVQMVYHGQAVLHDSFIYPELANYNPNLPQYKYNTDISNRLLDDGGYTDTDGDGFRNNPESGKNLDFKFLVPSSDTEEVKMASLIREQMKKIGIGIKINVVDVDTYYDLLYWPQNPVWDISFVSEEPGPYASWIWEFSKSWNDKNSIGWNCSYYDNPEFDKLLDAFNSEVDLEKAKILSHKMQEIIAHDLPYYIICRPNAIDPVRTDKLEGYVAYMGGVSSWINPFTYFNVHPK
ncbi:MAG: peptide ABC transporter substrate-binding protein [Desulfobacterales bacterium]|nr:peptide ABC transporter substrate-binding protein [Desulfobacterales bacterium]